ncbi:MAG: hypothetical protein LUD27_05490 [Clostridia bacterium]|nr:hypothetical protein [Clostridia bacterium]
MSKLRLKLVIVLAICAAVCMFAGCSIGLDGIDQYRDYYNTTASVTYYGNGGYFDSAVSMTLEYTTGSTFYSVITKDGSTSSDSSSSSSDASDSSADDSSTDSSADTSDDSSSSDSSSSGSVARYVSRSNYELVGWYEVLQRTDGETVLDEDGNAVEEGTLYFVLDITEEELAGFTKVSSSEYTYSVTITSPAKSFTVSIVKDDFIENDDAWLITQEDYDLLADAKKYDGTVSFPSVQYGEEVLSSFELEDDSHLYVAAKWSESACIRYYVAILHGVDGYEADSITITVSGESAVYEEGDYIASEYYDNISTDLSYYYIQRSDSEEVTILINSTATVDDATFVGYYYDADCTNAVNGAMFKKPADGASDEEKYISIYACYIPGDWTLVRSYSDVKTMLSSRSAVNYYVMNDIDCSKITDLSPLSALNARIEGNGYTLSNLTYKASDLAYESYTGIFGQLNKSAVINNLYIDNLNVTYTAKGTRIYAYLLFSSVLASSGSTQINGLNINNVTFTISGQDSLVVLNIRELTSSYEDDNWLYGIDHADDETDAAFAATYGGATVTNYTVIINGTTAITDITATE